MTLLFSEHGSRVGCFDTDKEAVKTVLQQAKEDKVVDEKLVHGFSSLDKLVEAFPTGKSTQFYVTNDRREETSNARPIPTPRKTRRWDFGGTTTQIEQGGYRH